MIENKSMSKSKVAWGITGAGHFLFECVEILCQLREIDVFLTRAAVEVLGNYRLWEKVQQSGHNIFQDTGASSGPVTKLYGGSYQTVVIAPVTANSMAKMKLGIADTLVTNLFAQAGKCQIRTVLLPCDIGEETETTTPNGDKVPVYIRAIDRANVAFWEKQTNVAIVRNPTELNSILK